MLVIDVKTETNFDRITKRAEEAAVDVFSEQAARIEQDAKESIVESDQPSQAGKPPHTRGKPGRNLPESIASVVDKDGAMIGTQASVIGELGAVFEFGERFKGQDFEIRAFMGPALDKSFDRLARDWYGMI